MTKGATIQFRTKEIPMCIQIWRDEKSLGRHSNCTFVRTAERVNQGLNVSFLMKASKS